MISVAEQTMIPISKAQFDDSMTGRDSNNRIWCVADAPVQQATLIQSKQKGLTSRRQTPTESGDLRNVAFGGNVVFGGNCGVWWKHLNTKSHFSSFCDDFTTDIRIFDNCDDQCEFSSENRGTRWKVLLECFFGFECDSKKHLNPSIFIPKNS